MATLYVRNTGPEISLTWEPSPDDTGSLEVNAEAEVLLRTNAEACEKALKAYMRFYRGDLQEKMMYSRNPVFNTILPGLQAAAAQARRNDETFFVDDDIQTVEEGDIDFQLELDPGPGKRKKETK